MQPMKLLLEWVSRSLRLNDHVIDLVASTGVHHPFAEPPIRAALIAIERAVPFLGAHPERDFLRGAVKFQALLPAIEEEHLGIPPIISDALIGPVGTFLDAPLAFRPKYPEHDQRRRIVFFLLG